MNPNDSDLFADDADDSVLLSEAAEPHAAPLAPWKLLIVDDDPDVHDVTQFALGNMRLEGRPLSFLNAYSGREGLELARANPDVALAFLDVVMESEDAGLRLARAIREQLHNRLVRIVLRTGQPGQAPARHVILDYDINDYNLKSELTSSKLFTTVVAALRAYRDMETLERNRRGLQQITEASSSIFQLQTPDRFRSELLTQLTALLRTVMDTPDAQPSLLLIGYSAGERQVLGGTGRFASTNTPTDRWFADPAIDGSLTEALTKRSSLFFDDHAVLFLRGQGDSHQLIYLAECALPREPDRKLLEIFCGNAATAYDNILLNQEVEETQREIICLLGEITENRNKETGGHIKRVGEYCRLLAELIGLSAEEAGLIRDASPMHDLGKIAIPDAILNKPGPLTAEEFEHIKQHPRYGYEMLRHSQRRLMQAAAQIAYQHHERYDGTGYPRGLAGEKIHLYGRIVAVADVFDALASRRAYKDPWNAEDIKALFREQRGRHFDPVLVDLLLDNYDAFQAINEQYPD